jgi:hypothetical protein
MSGTRAEAEAAAERLRAALQIVEQDWPAGELERERDYVARNIELAISALIEDSRRICRRCGQSFVFDAPRFRAMGLESPRHCYNCRLARKAEREAPEAW